MIEPSNLKTLNAMLIPIYGKMFVPNTGMVTILKPTESFTNFNITLSSLGYVANRQLCDAVASQSDGYIDTLTSNTEFTLRDLRGGNVGHSVLFKDFPSGTVNDALYLTKRIVNHMLNVYGVEFGDTARPLSCGHIIDTDIFEIEKFGACPICQYQVDELTGTDPVDAITPEQVTPLTILGGVDEQGLVTILNDLLAQPSSLSQIQQRLVILLLETVDLIEVVVPKTIFKETLPLVAVHLLDHAGMVFYALSGATDVLRIATYMSDHAADLSLSTNTKFKLKNKERHFLLSLINAILDTGEDMMRHREKWLRLGEVLHPKKFEKRYPIANIAFDKLRSDPKSIETFNRLVEGELVKIAEPDNGYDVSTKLFKALKSRPSEFGRRLDYVLRCHKTEDGENAVMYSFSQIVDQLPIMIVLSLIRYFENRDMVDQRYFIPKGIMNKIQIVPDTRPTMSLKVKNGILYHLKQSLHIRFVALPIMPMMDYSEVYDFIIPFNSRGDSESSRAVSKWSQIPNKHDGIVRLFTYWKAPVDVDVSVVLFDKDMGMMHECSYQDLNPMPYIEHSGDIQNGEKGATEFIDINTTDAINDGVRYLVMFTNLFYGNGYEGFDEFECFAGFMNRDGKALCQEKNFSSKNVEWKFNLDKPVNSIVPIIFDLQKQTVIYADVVLSFGQLMNVGNAEDKIRGIMDVILNASNTKPTIGQLLQHHEMARQLDPTNVITVTADDVPTILKEYLYDA